MTIISEYLIEFNKTASLRNKSIAKKVCEDKKGEFFICPICDGTGYTEDYERWCKYCRTKGFVDWMQRINLMKIFA